MQDLHTHTVLSDGTSTIDEIYRESQVYGIEVGISDHILCKKMCDRASVVNYLDTLSGYPVLRGGEIDLGETGILDDLIVSKSDYIIGSIHSVDVGNQKVKLGKYFDYRDKGKILHTDYIFDDYTCCKALDVIWDTVRNELSANPITILGHCTVNPFYEQVNAKYRYEWENELIALCKTNNTAIEISGLWIEPCIDFIKRSLKNKVKISFGSDCHTQYTKNCMDYFNFILQNVNIEEGDTLTIVR